VVQWRTHSLIERGSKLAEEISESRDTESNSRLRDAQPTSPPEYRSRAWQGHRELVEAEVLRLVKELGAASIKQVHQRMVEGSARIVSYPAVGTVLRELAKEGKLAVQRDEHSILYRLRTKDDNVLPAPPPSATTPTPHHARTLRRTEDLQMITIEQAVLEAIRKLGTVNLDQIYRAWPGGIGITYAEVARAVRSLVQKRLVTPIHERNRYFYRVAERAV
jgi:predicted transcriptional regulator